MLFLMGFILELKIWFSVQCIGKFLFILFSKMLLTVADFAFDQWVCVFSLLHMWALRTTLFDDYLLPGGPCPFCI